MTVAYGDSKTVVWTNQLLPSEGGTRTIGYWKNWSSCTKGKQYEKALASGDLTGTLDYYLGGAGFESIYPIGNIAGGLDCEQAFNLLSKNAINGQKRPGDPIYNMVAQLLGAKLNVAAGTFKCPALATALTDAQTLLVAIGFNGTGSYAKNGLTAQQRSDAITLAGILGSYNEGTLGGTCPTHA